MVAEAFDESFPISRSSSEGWEILIDVERVSGWVSIVRDVTEHQHLSHYSAVLEDRMGPFKLRADLEVTVTSVVEGSRITVRADGEDRQVGSRITVDATLGLEPMESNGCMVTIEGQYEVTGRVATMGASTIRQKADKVLAEFVESAKRELG